MTVQDNVEYGLRIRKVDKAERRRRAGEALEMVSLSGYGARKPAQLSGGQRQRVALARAIVNRPRLLLLDEPLGALDLKLRQGMQVELKRIQGDVGITFIYVTHDQEEALTMSDRLAVFDDGRIVQVGAPAEVYERPADAFVAGFVGVSNMLERDGRRFTVRPEKIRILDAGETAPGTTSSPARSPTSPTPGWSPATSSRSTRVESFRSSARTSRRRLRTRSSSAAGRCTSRGVPNRPTRSRTVPPSRRKHEYQEPVGDDRRLPARRSASPHAAAAPTAAAPAAGAG